MFGLPQFYQEHDYRRIFGRRLSLVPPLVGNVITAFAEDNHKASEIQGQTRLHVRLIDLPGVELNAVGVNTMDCDTVGYKQWRSTRSPKRRRP